jgi:hypothetical protein
MSQKSRGRLPRAVRDGAIAYVSVVTSVPARLILSEVRDRPVARARQQVMWFLRKEGFSYPEIGRVMGRDHSTVVHAFNSVELRHPSPTFEIIHRFNPPIHNARAPKQANILPMKQTRDRLASPISPPKTWPTEQRIRDGVMAAALCNGIEPEYVLSGSRRPAAVLARKAAWADLIGDGYPLFGIAAVWGCDRKSLYRVKREMEAA